MYPLALSSPLPVSLPPLLVTRPQRSDYVVTAGYWALATCFILPAYASSYGWGPALAAMLYNIALDTATVFFLVFGLLPRLLAGTGLASSLAMAVGLLAASGLLYGWGYQWLVHEPNPATFRHFISNVLQHGRSYGVFGLLLIGKSYFEGQRRILLLQQAQTESELKSLRAQIDPHFLFNNLNILYSLIQRNQQEASHFLSCFSSLYRYLIRHRDADFVSLADELRFADEYVYLLRHRFGRAYDFRQVALPAAGADALAGLYVVPATLQVLLENVIKHNSGDEDNPLPVIIEIRADTLTVRNRVAPKRTPVDSTGTGLSNLRERYRLLSSRELHVYHAEFFEVEVPLLRLGTR